MEREEKRARLTAAGQWLRHAREQRGFTTGKSFADALGMDPSQLSKYESGVYEVTDERAKQIAAVLRLPVVNVRRGLGMWVPDETPTDASDRQRDERIADLRRLSDQLRTAIDELSG
ncbi:MAG: helix-turn-helix domain-containing protein [Acidimicrobiales bacterium]